MPDPVFDPSKPFEPIGADAVPTFDPSKPFEPASEETRAGNLASTVTDIPHQIYRAGSEAVGSVKENLLNQDPTQDGAFGGFLKTGQGLMAIPGVVAAPITGAARSILGHTRSAITGIPFEETIADSDKAMMALGPRGGLSPMRGPVTPPAAPVPNGPLGVTLSEGQLTRELPLIQREQAALRNTEAPGHARAQEFAQQQAAEVAQAQENVARGLDPYGMKVAESPQEAGQLVSEGVQQAAAAKKAQVKQAYDEANAMPGEIHAGAFEGIGQKIKGDLTIRDEPVIIDSKTTPHANNALSDIENTIDRLRIPNKADPFGEPNPENITGVSLKGVEQIRKRLSTFRKDAYGSGNASDGRATSAIIDAFDKRVDAAVDAGMFNGDPRAVQAWKDARAAHADYQGTFTAGKNDAAGRVVEKILGKGNNPAAIPNDVADFMYGSSGTNPSSLNVAVAKRIRGILGENSPEWSAVRQGLFSRLVESGEGVTPMGPGKIAQRVNKFLNVDGKELSNVLFSPSERAMIQRYGELHRALEVPQSGANWSNTATFMGKTLDKIGGKLGMVVGAALGRTLFPGLPPLVSEGMGAGLTSVAGKGAKTIQARQVAKQMPLVADQMKQWQKAAARAAKLNSPPGRAALATASMNLAKSLQPFGFNVATTFGELQGTAPGNATNKNEQ